MLSQIGNQMEMYKFTWLLWQFNMMLDSGNYDTITVSDIKAKIYDDSLSAYLRSQAPDADFGMIAPEDWVYLTHEWKGFADVIDEDRKMGVVNRGICLLLAYTLNGLQLHPDNPRNKSR